jgi:hypothetical protein
VSASKLPTGNASVSTKQEHVLPAPAAS